MVKIIKPLNLNLYNLKYNNNRYTLLINNNFFLLLNKIFYSNKNYYYTDLSKLLNLLNWFVTLNLNVYKINFFGRGYKIITKKNKNILIFNKSHISIFYSNNIWLKLNKKNIIIVTIDKNTGDNTINNLSNIKKYNIYKKLGIRCNKLVILKKKGKNITN